MEYWSNGKNIGWYFYQTIYTKQITKLLKFQNPWVKNSIVFESNTPVLQHSGIWNNET